MSISCTSIECLIENIAVHNNMDSFRKQVSLFEMGTPCCCRCFRAFCGPVALLIIWREREWQFSRTNPVEESGQHRVYEKHDTDVLMLLLDTRCLWTCGAACIVIAGHSHQFYAIEIKPSLVHLWCLFQFDTNEIRAFRWSYFGRVISQRWRLLIAIGNDCIFLWQTSTENIESKLHGEKKNEKRQGDSSWNCRWFYRSLVHCFVYVCILLPDRYVPV